MIDFGRPYSVSWKVFSVNEDTWDEEEELRGVLSASIDRDCTDDVPLYETSSMSVVVPVTEEFEDGWYRIVADVLQNGQCERYPLTTQLYQSANDETDYGVTTVSVNGRSVLTLAQEGNLLDGSFVPKGYNGADWIVDQLTQYLYSPVYKVGDGFSVDRYIVFDSGESVLSACWSVLDMGRWCLQIDGRGVVYIMPRPSEPDAEFDISNLHYLLPNIRRSGKSMVGVPNRYRASDYDKTEVAENHDPSSPVSYERLGRWVDVGLDTSPEYLDGESLWSYANRRLEEESTLIRSYDYDREYWPDVLPFSLVRASLVNAGFVGDLRVTKQKLTLDRGIQVSETANEEIKLWRA